MQIRRAGGRGHTKLDWLDSWHSFSFDNYYDPKYIHFGPLRVINEDIIEPGEGFGMHAHREMEILTYVISGGLQHRDSLGNGSIIHAGEIQRMSAGTGIQHSEFNASPSQSVHLLQIWILPAQKEVQPGYEQVQIADGVGWQLIAAAIKQPKAVLIHQNVAVYLAKAKPGEKLSLAVNSGRLAWLQLIKGVINIDGQMAGPGDGISLDRPVTTDIYTKDGAEILLFDLPVE
jgi:quercetin 2,3-dioxygenase